MLSGLAKGLIAMGIRAGLADRDQFVKNVAELIERYRHDPEEAEKWAKATVDYLEELKDDIRLQQNISSSISGSNIPSQDKIDELTRAINKLTEELQKEKK